MALFDDRRFLLSHINHSFITGDDTGICEVVMLDEDVFDNQHRRCLKLEGQDTERPEDQLEREAYDLEYESELFASGQGQSYDIASDLDYISHRRRSNTAQRLDRLKKEKHNQSKTKTIVWRPNSPILDQEEDELSTDLTQDAISENGKLQDAQEKRRSKSPPRKSGLTRLLERFPSLPKNPFDEYAQFDGGMSEVVPVKKIIIYIAINQPKAEPLSENETKSASLSVQDSKAPDCDTAPSTPKTILAPQPNKSKNSRSMEVVVVSTAKVQDLIGLICWQYTNEGHEPKLQSDISKYCLRIVEDNGDVDPDFSSLNPKEQLSKFNFPSLALTEKIEERADRAVRTYNEHRPYTNGTNLYNHRPPTIAPNVIPGRISNTTGRFAALIRIIFKDAKLDANQ